jgi:S1-C subfamily serine protease
MKQKHWIATLGAALLTFAAAAAPLAAKPEAKPEKPQSGEESAPLVSGLEDLNRLDRNLVALAGKASPATVSLMSIGGHGAGSGVVVSSDGVILTAGHVLAAMSDDIIVLFPDGRRAKAKPLGADFDRDAGW